MRQEEGGSGDKRIQKDHVEKETESQGPKKEEVGDEPPDLQEKRQRQLELELGPSRPAGRPAQAGQGRTGTGTRTRTRGGCGAHLEAAEDELGVEVELEGRDQLQLLQKAHGSGRVGSAQPAPLPSRPPARPRAPPYHGGGGEHAGRGVGARHGRDAHVLLREALVGHGAAAPAAGWGGGPPRPL